MVGWDSEITGFWIAKFEAGYASGNNDALIIDSSVLYTQATAYVRNIEAGRVGETDGVTTSARNWLDGIYENKTTTIKYPVFQGTTYSMNYINHNDAFNIARKITENDNIYGFNSSQTDSHLLKDSEWGAVAYLAKSKYGVYDREVSSNPVSLNSQNRARTEINGRSGVDSVYAVTGCTTGSDKRRRSNNRYRKY